MIVFLLKKLKKRNFMKEYTGLLRIKKDGGYCPSIFP
jgi:hypothetical protein